MLENNEFQVKKNQELEAVTFEDIETVEEIVTGAVSGLVACCIA